MYPLVMEIDVGHEIILFLRGCYLGITCWVRKIRTLSVIIVLLGYFEIVYLKRM